MYLLKLITYIFLVCAGLRLAHTESNSASTNSPSSTISLTNAGPLMTKFEPPPFCFYPTKVLFIDSASGAYLAFTSWFTLSWESTEGNAAFYEAKSSVVACYPTGTISSTYLDLYSYYYSPGICPTGWTYAESDTTTSGEETGAKCCPVGFTRSLILSLSGSNPSTNDDYCVSTPAGGFVTASAVLEAALNGRTIYFRSTSTAVPGSALGPITQNYISIRWRAKDLEHLTTTAPTPLAASTSSGSGTATTSPHGLSRGAKIGIGVGIPLLLLTILLCLGAFILRRRARARKNQQLPKLDGAPAIKHELETKSTGTTGLPAELSSDAKRHEFSVAYELPAQRPTESTEVPPPNPVLPGPPVAPIYSETEENKVSLSSAVETTNTAPISPTPVEDEELAWLEAEEARIRERKLIVQDLRRLREEEHKLTEDEAAIRARINLKRSQS